MKWKVTSGITKTITVAVTVVFLATSTLVLPKADATMVHPSWRMLLYLDADNNLDVNAGAHHIPVVQDDLDELMSVGSTEDVDVYVLVDRWEGAANLFKVYKGYLEELVDFELNGMEVNMGDPMTVRSFVSYTFKASSADHTLLIFWNHGSPEYIARDDNPGDILTHQEVVQTLSGYHIDVMAADECLVGQTEVAYEYVAKGLQVNYLVAAETYTGWRGFPYDAILRDLVANPKMCAREVSLMMVEETSLLLNQQPYMGEEVNCHAAIDMSMVSGLVTSLKSLTDLLVLDMKTNAKIISQARGAAQYCYGANALNLIDLKTFVLQIASNTQSLAIKNACAAVIDNFEATVIGLQVTKTMDHMIYGLGIALPNHSWEVPDYYYDFAFPSQGWMDFLEAYWAASGSI